MIDLPDLKYFLPYLLCIGAFTAYFAHHKRGRRPIPWFFLGVCFGLMALFTLLFLPKKSPAHPLPAAPQQPSPLTLPMINELWYFLDHDGRQIGPMSFSVFKENYIKGRFSESSYVWNALLENWRPINELTDYLTVLKY